MSRLKIVFLVCIHILFWILNYKYVTSNNLSWNGLDNVSGSLAIAYLYGIFFNAFLFYLYVFFLVPKYFITQKKILFWVFSILIFILITSLETYLDIKMAKNFNTFSKLNISIQSLSVIWFYHNSIFHFFYCLIGFLYRFQFEYYKSEKKKQQLLKETYAVELKYLKAQLNPHFLFNGINSIYHLITKNSELAKNTLLQFSGLLRYQLYESNTKYILLKKELEYLLLYIKMEKTRKGEDITLNYTIDDYYSTPQEIAPLLLIPFIENAFKYCSNNIDSTANIIIIEINELQNRLSMIVKNTYDLEHVRPESFGGLGLINVKRRLALLYPEKHKLIINKQDGFFSVHLSIDL